MNMSFAFVNFFLSKVCARALVKRAFEKRRNRRRRGDELKRKRTRGDGGESRNEEKKEVNKEIQKMGE